MRIVLATFTDGVLNGATSAMASVDIAVNAKAASLVPGGNLVTMVRVSATRQGLFSLRLREAQRR